MAAGESSKPVVARAALERVLARAAELQARGEGDEAGGLTEAQLIEVAGEVGLSRDVVRQALAEERSRVDVPAEGGAAFSMLGTAVVQAARTVPGDARAALVALDSWMQRSESLQVKRRYPDQLAWEPRQDFLSTIRRAVRVDGRAYTLAAATEVHAIVAAVEGNRSHVRAVARFEGARAARANGALTAVAAGLIVGIPLFWMATEAGLAMAAALSLVPALALPAATIALVRRRYRALLARAQVALEQALDRLEYGDPPRRGLF